VEWVVQAFRNKNKMFPDQRHIPFIPSLRWDEKAGLRRDAIWIEIFES